MYKALNILHYLHLALWLSRACFILADHQRAPKTTYCPLVAAESLSFMYKQCICGTVALYGPFFFTGIML
jgi:hypothetical protein